MVLKEAASKLKEFVIPRIQKDLIAWCALGFPLTTRRIMFTKWHGYALDLHDPTSFNEKMQYRLIYDHDPIYRIITSKYYVPYYVKAKIGDAVRFAKRYATLRSLQVNDFEALPDRFVVKSSHGSATNVIVEQKSSLDLEAVSRKMNKAIKRTRNARFRKDRQAVIIIEELLSDDRGGRPQDYKFHCFHDGDTGDFRYVLQFNDRSGALSESHCDEDFNVLGFTWNDRASAADHLVKPANFEVMVDLARRLSEDFDYLRVDLYNLGGQIYFSELSPFHLGGFGRVCPAEWDHRLGTYWRLRKIGTEVRF